MIKYQQGTQKTKRHVHMQQIYTSKLIYALCHRIDQLRAYKLKIWFLEHKTSFLLVKGLIKISKHVKNILSHLELFKQVSNDKTKLFKWSFGLKNKEIKKLTLETSYFLENTT